MSDFQQLFPDAKLQSLPSNDPKDLSVAQTDGQWLILNRDKLSLREQELIHLLQPQQNPAPILSPWSSYLIQGQGRLPQPCKKIQWIHVHVQQTDQELLNDWLEVFSQFFPNLLSNIRLSKEDFIFILKQDTLFKTQDILTELLPSLEFDFSMKISAFIGQIWPENLKDSWPLLFQAEQELFQYMMTSESPQTLLRFNQVLLSHISHPASTHLYSALSHLLKQEDDLVDTVAALWKTQAVLTKTAQHLYIHRNTLQYRLDKFEEQTGLSLKTMDDLTIAYLALRNH